ncbi:MAG TPA: hypothetical protein VFT98_00455 [Myxococcota bacterium]|nr:hypothetical protein [Myxococcota bacterium]
MSETKPSVAERLMRERAEQGEYGPPGYAGKLTLTTQQADALVALSDAVRYSITDNDWTPCDPLCPGCEPIECPPSKLARAFAAFAKSLEVAP